MEKRAYKILGRFESRGRTMVIVGVNEKSGLHYAGNRV